MAALITGFLRKPASSTKKNFWNRILVFVLPIASLGHAAYLNNRIPVTGYPDVKSSSLESPDNVYLLTSGEENTKIFGNILPGII